MVFGPKSFFPDDGRSSFLSGVADTPEMAVKDTRAVKMDVKSIVMSMCSGCGARYEISWGLPYRFIVSQRLRFRLRLDIRCTPSAIPARIMGHPGCASYAAQAGDRCIEIAVYRHATEEFGDNDQ